MNLRCVWVSLLLGVTWAGLTRKLSSCFLLINFKIIEGHNISFVYCCDFYHFKAFTLYKDPSQCLKVLLCSIIISSNFNNTFFFYFRGF